MDIYISMLASVLLELRTYEAVWLVGALLCGHVGCVEPSCFHGNLRLRQRCLTRSQQPTPLENLFVSSYLTQVVVLQLCGCVAERPCGDHSKRPG